jgi:hypothetical protein
MYEFSLASEVEYDNIFGFKHGNKSYSQCGCDQGACVSHVRVKIVTEKALMIHNVATLVSEFRS